MNRTGFVMSMLLCLLGVILLSFGLLIQALLPKIGRMAWMIGGHGGYSSSEYGLGLWYYLYLAIALLCLVSGIVSARRFSQTDPSR